MIQNLKKLAFLAVLSAQAVFGLGHWQGYCNQGGQKVVTNSAQSTTQVQQSYPYATLTVYLTSSPLTKATLYQDNAGLTPLGNPLTCNVRGYFSFYAAPDYLDLTFSGTGISQPFTWGAVAGQDPNNAVFDSVTTDDLTVNDTAIFKGPIVGGSNVTISPASPLYLYSHFRDDDVEHLRLAYSRDALNWTEVNKQGSYTTTEFRDPSVMYIPNTNTSVAGTFHFIASPAPGGGCQLQYIKSTDLVTYTAFTNIDMGNYVPGCVTAWAPEWWKDPNNGFYYFWVAVGTVAPSYNTPKTPYLVRVNPTTGAVVGTPAPITINNTSQSNTFDYYLYYSNSTYYMLYVDQTNNPTVTQPIAMATSSTLTGPYTQQTTPGVDYYGFGTFQTEAPALIPLGTTGCVRIMVDKWNYPLGNVPPVDIGRDYSQLYRDTCPGGGPLFTTPSLVGSAAPVNIGGSEHGTVIPLTGSVDAAVVYNAMNLVYINNAISGNHCINVPVCQNLLTVKALPSTAGGLTDQQVPSLALGYGAYNSGYDAILSPCVQVAQGCWPGNLAGGRFFQGYLGDGAFGMHQFINWTQGGTGEASIMFADGFMQPGSSPSSTEGLASIWTIGENNQAFDLTTGNHHFFLYNGSMLNQIYVPLATVNTNGTTITRVTGSVLGVTAGMVVLINNVKYTVNGTPGPTSFTVTVSAGVQAGVTFARITAGGLPWTVSPVTGDFHANYSLSFGGGPGTAYGHVRYASLYSMAGDTTGVLNLDDGSLADTAVNTNGTAVSWVDGPTFTAVAGDVVFIQGTGYVVTGVPTATALTITTSAGIQWGAQFAESPKGVLRLKGVTFNRPGSLDSLTSTVADPVINMGSGIPGMFDASAKMKQARLTTAGAVYGNVDVAGSDSVVCPNCGQRINFGDGLAVGNRNANLAARSLNVTNYVAQSGGTNTDLSGFLVLDGGGVATRNFTIGSTSTYSSQPLCTGSDATAANAVRVYTSTSGSTYILHIEGTAGDTVNYVCIARGF